MDKFKIDDRVKSVYGYGIVNSVSADGSHYLIDDEDFNWVKEEELELQVTEELKERKQND